jgi:hypothetical protein
MRKTQIKNPYRKTKKKKKATKPKKSKRIVAPKTRNHNTWSEGEFFSRIRSALRRTFRYWKPMQLALDKASRPSQSSNKRIKKEYQCAKCGKWSKRADVQIDHIEECGSLNTYHDIIPFIERLTKENVDAYQILCKETCHKDKTKAYLNSKKSTNSLHNGTK